jgi:hypothetical protein
MVVNSNNPPGAVVISSASLNCFTTDILCLSPYRVCLSLLFAYQAYGAFFLKQFAARWGGVYNALKHNTETSNS